MADESGKGGDIFADMLRAQAEATMALFGKLLPETPKAGASADWSEVAQNMQAMWSDFQPSAAAVEAPLMRT